MHCKRGTRRLRHSYSVQVGDAVEVDDDDVFGLQAETFYCTDLCWRVQVAGSV